MQNSQKASLQNIKFLEDDCGSDDSNSSEGDGPTEIHIKTKITLSEDKVEEIDCDDATCSETRKSFVRVMNCDNAAKGSAMALSISSKQSEIKDESLAFAELVTLKLQKFDEVSKLKIQHQINLVLYDAEMSVLKS